jgi:hypothetical protein
LIPPLHERGYVPPGVHQATLNEVIARFGPGDHPLSFAAEAPRILTLLRAALTKGTAE